MLKSHNFLNHINNGTWIGLDDKRKKTLAPWSLMWRPEVFQDDNPFVDWKPNDCSVEECSGNAGVAMERWYQQAGLVLWPHVNRVAIKLQLLLHNGFENAVKTLQDKIKEQSRVARVPWNGSSSCEIVHSPAAYVTNRDVNNVVQSCDDLQLYIKYRRLGNFRVGFFRVRNFRHAGACTCSNHSLENFLCV